MPSERDRMIARVCLEKGYATPDQVGECLRRAADADQSARPFEELLRRHGYITERVYRELSSLQHSSVRTPGADTLKRCAVCGSVHGGDLCPTCLAGFGADSTRMPDAPPSPRPERPAAPLDPALEQAVADPTKHFGKYVLLQELGAGGMGVVFKAWQTDLRRIVALKFIRGVESQQDRERFFREAQLAATLSHPGIAPIYESGAHDGKHFFAMQYVEGRTFDHALAARPKPALRTSVELLARVAEAVGYAHEHGIIHRDLKPSNVMVDPRGRAYVMDFGLAKSVRTGSSLTGSGFAVGTPSYMSPEQARGKAALIGPRSDVYALGAVLYEIAAGRPPFVGDDAAQVLMDVVHAEPVPPRRLDPAVPVELETVALKALEKDPARRYASAEDFAADLRRWLDGEPVLARPVGAVSRLARRLRKHKLATAGAAALLAGALLALGVWSLRAGEQRARADARPYFEEASALYDSADRIRFVAKAPDEVLRSYRAQLQRAETNAAEAARRDPTFADAHYLRGRIRRQLAGEEDGDADLTRAIRQDPAHLRAYIERGLLRLDRLAAKHGIKTVSQRTSSPLPQFTWNERTPQADALRAEILADLEAASRLAGRDFEKALLQGAVELATWRPGRDEGLALGEAHLERARTLQANDPAPLRLLSLARLLRGDYAGAAAHAATAVELAPNDPVLLFHAAMHLLYADRTPEARAAVDRALRIHPGQVSLLNLRGNLLSRMGDGAGARAAFEEALARDPKNTSLLCNLGFLLHRTGRNEEAVDAYGRAAAADPADPDGYEGRAVALLALGRTEEAEKDFDRVIERRPTSDAYANRGAARSRAGRLGEADEDFAKALELDPRNAGAHFNVGILRQREGKTAEAAAAYRRAIDLGRVQADGHLALARMLIRERAFEEAEEAAGKAIAMGLAAAWAVRGQARTEQGKLEEGLADYLQALEKQPEDGGVLRDVGLIHLKARRPSEALPFLERAGRAGRTDASPLLGESLLQLGRLEEAEAAFTQAVEALPRDPLPRFGRARVRQAAGRRADAIADLDEALALSPKFAGALALRGVLRLEADRRKEALADLRRAIELQPSLKAAVEPYLEQAARDD
jgi:tetratricopeptide (TPR) repeat protein/predicted Ser/Thr protein kinase